MALNRFAGRGSRKKLRGKATNLNPVAKAKGQGGWAAGDIKNIVTQMKQNSRTILTFLILLAFVTASASPVIADSRSATVRVTCTILPMLEISTPNGMSRDLTLRSSAAEPADRTKLELKTTGSLVSVGTNLGKNYHLSETLLKKPEGLIKLYSVTAL